MNLPQNLFPFPRTGHLKFARVQLNVYIVNFLVCQSSCFIPISTMALNSSATVMTLHKQRVMTPSKMTLLLCWWKFFDDNTVDDFVSFVKRSVDVKYLLCSLNAAGKSADITHRRMTCSLLFFWELCLLQIPQQERGDTTKFVENFLRESFSSLLSLGQQKWVSTFP